MEEQNNYDFLSMGKRYAISQVGNLIKKAQEIEQEYGIDARLEFESGIALAIPVYSEFAQEPYMSRIEQNGREK